MYILTAWIIRRWSRVTWPYHEQSYAILEFWNLLTTNTCNIGFKWYPTIVNMNYLESKLRIRQLSSALKLGLPCNSRVCINKLTHQRQFLVHRNCKNYALPWVYLNWVLTAIHNEFHLVVLWIIRPSCFGRIQIPLLSLSHWFTHATILRGFPVVVYILTAWIIRRWSSSGRITNKVTPFWNSEIS